MAVEPESSSTQSEEIQGDKVLSLGFSNHSCVNIDVDDYCEFLGERYTAFEAYEPAQKSTMEWRYELKLYGKESKLKRLLVLKRVDGENEPVFTLTAPPYEHARMIVNCLNEGLAGEDEWKVGIVSGTENITIDYFGKYCDEGLLELAEKTEAEWWTDGNTINISRCVRGEEIVLGYDKGLTQIEPSRADNVKFYTRLYPSGSTRNIDVEKYGHKRLQLPGGVKYVEVNAEKYGRVDHYEAAAFAHIYPRRTGKVSRVRSEERKGDDGKLFTIYYFADDTLTFDPNDYEIPHLVKRISFQEGSELGGLGNEDNGTYYFEAYYNSETKEFELITIWPYDDDTQLPGGVLIPKVGDEYILWNIRMPDEYYSMAEQEFLEAVNQYNTEHALDVAVYKCSMDHVWVEEQEADIFLGRRVRLESEYYFPETGYRDSRITKITRNVNLPSQIDIEIGDALSRTSMQKLSDSVNDARAYARSLAMGAALLEIIRTGDKTQPTDYNLFSAKRTLAEFLSKTRPDVAREVIDFLEGWEVGEWEPDAAGAKAWIDANGDANIEADILRVRKKAFFKSLVVAETEYIGGELAITPGCGIECTEVSAVDDGWRCWYMCKDTDGKRIHCKFKAGDFAKCQTFNLGTPEADGSYSDVANTYYWREVVAVGNPSSPDEVRTDEQGREYSYIVLSNAPGHYDPASVSEPHAGDHIVHLGNADDPLRQTAIIISTTATTAPSIVMYTGIDTFALANRAIITLGRDEQGNAWLRLGSKGAKHYLNYNQATGLDVCGNLHVSSGESIEELLGDKEGNYRLDLSPAALAVQCDAEGNITADFKDMPVLTVQAYLGNKEIAAYDVKTKKGVTYYLAATAGVEFYTGEELQHNEFRVRKSSGMSADTALVTVTAKVYNGGDDPVTILTNRATVYKVRPGVGGAPGDPGLRLVLSQSAMAVPCDAAGTPLAGTLPIEITATLYRGNEAVAPSGIKLTGINGFGTDGLTVDGNTIRISKILNQVNKATISATYGEYSAQATLSVTKVLNGAPGDAGQAAVVYTLEPTAAIVKRGALGLADPARVGVHVYRTTGNSPRQELADWSNVGLKVSYTQVRSKDDENSSVGYLAYGQTVTVAKDDKELIFGLYKDTALLAEVRVPVVEDMTDYEVGGVNLIHNTNQGAKGWDKSVYSYYRNSGGSIVGWNNADLFALTTDGKDVVATNGYKYPYKSKLDDNKQTHSYEPEEVTYQLKYSTGLASFESGKYYTLSLDLPLRYKCAVKDAMELRIGFGNDYDSVKTYHSETLPMQATLGDATIHVSATFKPSLDDSAANLYIYLVIKNPAAVVGGVAQSILDYIRVRNVMLERGTVATLWTPAPTDIDYLTKAFAEDTDINGGVVMTTRVRVGCTVNGKWTEYGGLNGAVTDVSGAEYSRAPILYCGGEMVDRATNTTSIRAAKAMIRQDGTAYFANNTVRFEHESMQVGDDVVLDSAGLHMYDSTTNEERLLITNDTVGALDTLSGATAKTINYNNGNAELNFYNPGKDPSTGIKPLPGFYLHSIGSLSTNILNVTKGTSLNVDVRLSATINGWDSQMIMQANIVARLRKGSIVVATYPLTMTRSGSEFTFATKITTILDEGNYTLEIAVPSSSTGGKSPNQTVHGNATMKGSATPTANKTKLGNDGLVSVWGKTALLVKEDEVTLVDGNAKLKVSGSEIHADVNNGEDELFVRLAPDGIWIRSNRLEPGVLRWLNFKKMLSADLFSWDGYN